MTRFKSNLLKIFVILLTVGISLPASTSEVSAASPAYNSLFYIIPDQTAETVTGSKYKNIGGLIPNVIEAMNEIMNGCNYTDALTATERAAAQGNITGIGCKSRGVNGLATSVNNLILEQRPASGITYAANVVNQVLAPSGVYAADAASYFPGTGWALLQPIQAFWGWAVTLAYGVMILFMIVVAFALMFRQKLGGKTVVTLQSAIPNIVIAMLLIPLSYPISGLFIDAVTLGTNVIHDVLFSPSGPASRVYSEGYYASYQNGTGEYTPGISYGPTDPATVTNPELQPYADPTARGLYADDPKLNVWNVKELIGVTKLGLIIDPDCQDSVDNTTRILGVFTVNSTACQGAGFGYELVTGIISFVGGFFGEGDLTLGTIIGAILSFLLSIVIFVTSIKIGIHLFKKLLVFMVMPMISPFVAASIAFSGTGASLAWSYVNSMSAATMSYIAVYALFLITIIFASPSFHNSIPNGGLSVYNPPLIGSLISRVTRDGVSHFYSDVGIIFQILAAVIFLNIPTILKDLDKRFKIPEGLPKFIQDARKEYDTSFRTVTDITSQALDSSPFLRSRIAKPATNLISGAANLPGNIIKGTAGRIPLVGGAANAAGNELNRRLGQVADPLARAFSTKGAPVSGVSDKRKGAFKYSLELIIPAASIAKSDAATDIKIKAGDYSTGTWGGGTFGVPAVSWPPHTKGAFPVYGDLFIKLDDESKDYLSNISLTEIGAGSRIIGTITGKQVTPPTDPAAIVAAPTYTDVSIPIKVTDAKNLNVAAGGTDDKKTISVVIEVPAGVAITQTFPTKDKIKVRIRGLDKDLGVRLTVVP